MICLLYTILVIIIGLILTLIAYVIVSDAFYDKAASYLVVLVGIILISIGCLLPHWQPEVKAAVKLGSEAEDLKTEAYETKIRHGGISEDLYNKILEHNENIEEKIDRNNFWIKAAGFNVDNCIVDISEYKVISENTFVQPVRVIDKTPESTTSTEESTDASEKMKQVVEIDGKYYELVPIN